MFFNVFLGGAKTKDFGGGFCRSNPELGVPHRFLKVRDAHGLLERGVKIPGAGHQNEGFFAKPQTRASAPEPKSGVPP